MSGAQHPSPRPAVNPWMIALTVLWCGLAVLALILLIAGAEADSRTYDQPGLPPSDVLAGIDYACSGVAAAVALTVLGVQLGVGALRWHLDPAARSLPRAIVRQADEPRPARQDF